MRIEVFADIVCPFTHVGLRRLRERRAERTSKPLIAVHAWPLEFVNGEPVGHSLVAREIAALRASVAPDLFTGFDQAPWPATSIPAFGLVASGYAREDATGEALSFAVRDALFEQGLDIADVDVLRHLGAPYGVTPLPLVEAEAATRRDFERGRNRLVRGSPHFFVGDRDWFCPSLNITPRGDILNIDVAVETMEEFYDVAFA
jgi:predicted DsbA family dithiol-disulfide isomerase